MVFACALAARARAWKLLLTAASCEGAVGGASGQQAAMVCGIVAGGRGHRAALLRAYFCALRSLCACSSPAAGAVVSRVAQYAWRVCREQQWVSRPEIRALCFE
jgi:hypothetical protein